MKIARKISLSFLITSVILTFISASIVFTVVKSNMQKEIFDHLETNVKSHAKHIEDFLEWHETLVEVLANDLLLRTAIEAIIKSEDTSLTDMAIAELEEVFEGEHFSKEFYELFVVDPDGRVILSTDKSNIGLDLSANIAFTEGKKETYFGDIYRHKKTEEESMDVATPILNKIVLNETQKNDDKAKPVVRQGRKATGLTIDSRVAWKMIWCEPDSPLNRLFGFFYL